MGPSVYIAGAGVISAIGNNLAETAFEVLKEQAWAKLLRWPPYIKENYLLPR